MIFVDREAQEESFPHGQPITIGQFTDRLARHLERWATRELIDDIALGFRDQERSADRPTAGTHHGIDGQGARERHADRAAGGE